MLRDFVEVACLPELPGQDPGQFGLVSITYTASIKLLELLANFAGALSCAFHYSFISKLVLFLVLKIVLMIVLFLVLNFVLMIVLFLVLKIVLMIVLFLVLEIVLMIVLFLVLEIVLMIVLFLVLEIVLMIVLFLVLNFVLMIVIPGFFDAQPAFAKLWPVLLLDRPGSRAPRPKLPRAKQPEFAKPAGLGFFCTDPETPGLNSEA